MSELERDPMHELLCAWLLGEASAEEARRVEAALAEDAALRAERTRLEALLGLVRTSLSDPERLSDASLQELLARAAGGGAHGHVGHDHAHDDHAHDGHVAPILPGPGWGGRGLVRAAAAVLVLGSGVWAVLQQSGLDDGDEDRVAYVDTRVVPSGPSEVLLEEVRDVRERLLLQRRDEILEAKLAEAETGATELSDRERQGLYFARAYLALEQEQPELAYKWAELGQQVDRGTTLLATDVPGLERQGEGAVGQAGEAGSGPADTTTLGSVLLKRESLYDAQDPDAYAEIKLYLAEAANERLAGTEVLRELAASVGAEDVHLDAYGIYAFGLDEAQGAGEVLLTDTRGVPVTGGLPDVGVIAGTDPAPEDAPAAGRRLLAEGLVVDGSTADPGAPSEVPRDALGRPNADAAADRSLGEVDKGRAGLALGSLSEAERGEPVLGDGLSVLVIDTGGAEGGKKAEPDPAAGRHGTTGKPGSDLPEGSVLGVGGGASTGAGNAGPSSPGPSGPASPGPAAPHSPGPAGPTTGGESRTRHSPGGGAYRGVGDTVPPGAGGGGGGQPPKTAGPTASAPAPGARAKNAPSGQPVPRSESPAREAAPDASRVAPPSEAADGKQAEGRRREAERRARTKTVEEKSVEQTEVELERLRQQLQYVQDLDVEIAQAATVVDPEASGSDDFFLGHGGLAGDDRADDGRGVRSRPEPLDPERVRQEVDRRITHIRQDCLRRPDERPRDMFFRWWGDNPWEVSERDRLSTFAADVDTASYVLARRYLRDGHLPERSQVRTEEFVNYFRPDLVAPLEETFAVTSELAPSPFGGSERRWMLRVGVRGQEVLAHERDPLAITFVLDVSGSMKENGRLELVKHAIRLLVSQLDARDAVALVVFNREARLVLPMTSAAQRGVIESALHPLAPDGGTNAEAGLLMGYEVAGANLTAAAHNRVVLLSDGVANVGQTDQDRINESVRRQRERGIYLNTIGVGMNNHNDVFLEQLANKGDGICDYVDDARAAERAIVERFTGAFTPIASDVKIQVEFDPTQVLRYRLLGYENRAVADQDFRNDAVDAGEIGAGHQVTALYEIERAAGFGGEQPLATVRLRWKEPKAAGQDPREVQVFEREHAVRGGEAVGHFDSGSLGYRRAVLAAQLAELLRRSTHARGDSVEALVAEVQRLADHPTYVGDADTQELLWMTRRAAELGLARAQVLDELDGTVDEYRRYRYLREQLEELEGELRVEELRALERTNEDLERRIRELLEREVRGGR